MKLRISLSEKSPRLHLLMSASYILLVLLFGIMYWLRNSGYSLDDSYITYRYAYHLKEGYGLVFNVGETYYGTTAAGYAVVLATVSMLGSAFGLQFTIPAIAIAMSAIALMVVATLLPVIARAGSDWRLWLVSLIGVVFLFYSYPFNSAAGHETYPFLAASLLGVVLVGYYRSYLSGGLFLALAATFRPDAILLVGIVPLLDWLYSGFTLREYLKNRNVIGFLVIYTLVLGSWLTYLGVHFGTAMPGTMAAKKVQVALGYWPHYTPKTLMDYFVSSVNYTGLIIVFVGVVAFIFGIRAKINIKLKPENFLASTWLLYGILSASAYFSFNVTFWFWYGVPILFSIFMVVFVGWVKINRWAEHINVGEATQSVSWLRERSDVLPVIILVSLVIGNTPVIVERAKTDNINRHISAYSEIVEYIQKDSPEGAIIQMMEPGSFGYHLGPEYTVVDELGLTAQGVAQALARGDYSWTSNQWHPKYLICSWRGDFSACSQDLGAYEFVGEFNRDFWMPNLKSGAKLYRLISSLND